MTIPLLNVTVTGSMTNTVAEAHDLIANFALRPELVYSMVSTVKPTRQSMRGSLVNFPFIDELSANTTALVDNPPVEITSTAMGDSQVQVTLLPYGHALQTDVKVRGTDFLEVDAVAANLIGWQAGLSYDTLAREVLEDDATLGITSDQVQVMGDDGSPLESEITATDTITTTSIKKAAAQLRGDNSRSMGGAYIGFMHPDVSFDLREEGASIVTQAEGSTTSTPQYQGFGLWSYIASNAEGGGSKIWDGIIGRFGGVDFVETSTADINLTGGSGGTVDTYSTVILGQEALAMAFAQNVSGATPHIVLGPVVDALRRFATVGWFWMGGFSEFRQESRHLILSASSLGGA